VLTSELPRLDELLRAHRIVRPEEPFAHDGWSGARLTSVRRGIRRFVIKRDSPATDWIAQATLDGPVLREAWFAARNPLLPPAVRAPFVGAAIDGDDFAIVMPDLTGVLFDWERPIDVPTLERVIDAVAAVHAHPWARDGVDASSGPWCPIRERLVLISRPSVEAAGPVHDAVGDRILPGWDAFDRQAAPAARDLIASLAADPSPLVDALLEQPGTLLHGDLKLANAGFGADGALDLIDWQMVMFAPPAIELGWFLASNVAILPVAPHAVFERYAAAMRARGAEVELDLAWIVGLLLRGWRKGIDAEAGTVFASGMTGAEDLALWCDRAETAASQLASSVSSAPRDPVAER
jgi:Phosphotransferase enzyme family